MPQLQPGREAPTWPQGVGDYDAHSSSLWFVYYDCYDSSLRNRLPQHRRAVQPACFVAEQVRLVLLPLTSFAAHTSLSHGADLRRGLRVQLFWIFRYVLLFSAGAVLQKRVSLGCTAPQSSLQTQQHTLLAVHWGCRVKGAISAWRGVRSSEPWGLAC